MGSRDKDRSIGYGSTDQKTFTIPNGQTGSAVEMIDFGRNVIAVVVEIYDCSHIANTTTLRVQAAYDDRDQACDLYEQNTPATKWVSGNLPTSGTLVFLLTHALGAQRLRFILSNPASNGDVTIYAYGLETSQY